MRKILTTECVKCNLSGRKCEDCYKAYNAEYYKQNRARIVAQRKTRREENVLKARASDRERMKRYKEKHGEEHKIRMRNYQKDYYQANKDKIKMKREQIKFDDLETNDESC